MIQTAQVLPFPKKRVLRGGSDHGHGTQIPKGLTLKEVRRLWKEFSVQPGERGLRNRALFGFFLESGLRCSEITRLQYSQSYETDDGAWAFIVPVKRSRTKKQRFHTVAISTQTLALVSEYHSKSGIESDVLFLSLPLQNLSGGRKPLSRQGLHKIVRSWNAKTRSGKDAHPHSFRATAGQLIAAKYGLNTVCQLLNHSSVSITRKHYLQPYLSETIVGTWRTAIEEVDV